MAGDTITQAAFEAANFLLVFGMAQEAERIGLCILERREPLDGQRRIAMKLAPEGVNNGSELQ